MKNKFSILIFTIFLILIAGSFEQVLACSCVWESPCQRFEESDLIFVGKVTKIQNEAENAYSVYFKVSESFKGVNIGDTANIKSYQNQYGSCGYKFDLDEEYLVFAKERGSTMGVNRFWSSMCSGNRKIKLADNTLSDTLKILRSLNNNDEGILTGRIQSFSDNGFGSLESVKVKAQKVGSKDEFFYGETNYYGEYYINLPFGKYVISPQVLEDFEVKDKSSIGGSAKNEVTTVRNGVCNNKDFIVLKQGK